METSPEQEQARLAAKYEGMRRAWRGIPDPDRREALAFYINYAKRHKTFTSADVLAAWRKTGDPVAMQDWRNRWGTLSGTLKSKKFQVIEFNAIVPSTNIQSHGKDEVQWRSLIYEGGEENEDFSEA